MRALMFGWEFPPHILGGLGTASYGLTKGMSLQPELYDGNPPFRGHGAMSYAPTVAEVLRAKKVMEDFVASLNEQQINDYGIGKIIK